MQNVFTNIIDWLQDHQLPCLIKINFKVDCPGCGIQRSFIELLKGNILESIKLYPGLMVMLVFFAILISNNKLKYLNGTKLIKIAVPFIFITILVSYIYKLTV